MPLKPRPTKAQPGDRPLPTKFRSMNAGVLMFQPTVADRAKIALGYAIRVHVQQVFQHNPGKVQVSARWEVVEHTVMKDTPKIPILQPPTINTEDKR